MRRSSFLLVLAGLLVAASMPPWGWWPLGFIGIALYGSVAVQRREKTFSTGFLFAAAWFLPSMAWMWFLTAPGYIVAILIFCVMHGVASYIAAKLTTNDNSHRSALVICHSLAEVLRLSFPFGRVPLATLAIGQVSGPLADLAPLMGVIGITTATLYLALTDHRFRAICVVGILVLVGGTWNSTQSMGRTLNLAIVQGGGGCQLAVVWRAPEVRNDLIMQNTMLVQGGHEIFHLYQNQKWGQYWDRVPDWVREGSANLGMSIILANFDGGKSFANYSTARNVEMNPKDKATCEASLQKWESNNTAEGFGNNKGCEYGLGLLMNEYLITKGFTLKDTLDMIGLIGSGTDFPTAFEKTYGMSTATYFRELRAYLKTLNYGW